MTTGTGRQSPGRADRLAHSDDGIFVLLMRLWHHFEPRRKRQFVLLLVLTIFTSFAEIFSLGAVLPFLAVLTDPERLFTNPRIHLLITAFGITTPKGLILPFTLAFGVAALVSGGMRLLQIWANVRVSFATGADLSISLFRRTLYQPYSVHVSRNSSEIINAVSSKAVKVIFDGIIPAIGMITSVIMLFALMATLIVIAPIISLLAFGGVGLIYAIIVFFARGRLKSNSRLIARESSNVVKLLQEGLGGIRDLLIDGNQAVYCDYYGKSVRPLLRAQGNNQFTGISPRFGIEATGMIIVAALAYWLTGQPDGFARALPILGAMAIGAQRILPVLQQLFREWSFLQGSAASFKDVLELLDQPLPASLGTGDERALPFRREIMMRNLSFRYALESPLVLHNITLGIPKGARMGIIGATGSGKSTLLDILMGLLFPTEGVLEVDGVIVNEQNQRSWQRRIAHVPQAVFLADSSIAENIAFGVPKVMINHERVTSAAQQAQIADLIESWPNKYDTFVGERGIRLSGGQRQRIGIARALYKRADVVIFDEATSALDSETESAVMKSIEELSKDLTILIIAHRLTTLKGCDTVVELKNGAIIANGSYENMVANRN